MEFIRRLGLWYIIVVLTACSSGKKADEQRVLAENLVDRIDLVDLDGNAVAIEDFKGKTIFLNYWATWCRPCLAEMPDIDAASKSLSADEFVFLAASDEELEKIKKFAEKVNYSFRIVQSRTSVFDMEIMALPTTLVINKNGEIVYNQVGARPWASVQELENLKNLAKK